MREAKDTKGLYFKCALVVILVVSLISVAFLVLSEWEKHQGLFPNHGIDEGILIYNDVEYVPKNNIETFLVMGLDKYEGTSVNDSYNNDQQADFLMLFIFDNEAKKCSTIHINRDTMTDVNVLGVAGNRVDTVTKQIALAHTYGNGGDVSCRNTADAVSELLMGVRINHYISLAMDSVMVMNDLVDGVEITVLEDFTEIDNTMVKGNTVTLIGEQALHYVRTRYGLEDSSNSTRMERQQQYINALYDKYIQKIESDEEFIIEASLAMSDYIVSDRSVTQLQELGKKFAEYEFVEIEDFDGDTVLGEKFMEFYPYDDSIINTVIANFYEPKE